MSKAQLVNRVTRMLVRPAPRNVECTNTFRIQDWRQPVTRRQQLFEGDRLEVLGLSRHLAQPGDWRDTSCDRLWLYHAHYFDDLCADDARKRMIWHEALMDRWIRENPPGSAPGWDPYPSSRRIVNWIKWQLGGGKLGPIQLGSLAAQADLLRRNLEYHLLGNHLLANAKALIFAGSTLSCSLSSRWLGEGMRLLRSQLTDQVLKDGGHYERSPMYHAQVVEDLLDLVNLTKDTAPEFAAELRELGHLMWRWLRAVIHPDGQIALLNDSTFDSCPPIQELERYARDLGVRNPSTGRPGLTLLKETGYARLESGPLVAIVDVGEVGDDRIPGHAHADTLNFELSVGGHRFIVDSGTSTYADTPERLRQRGTRAHNTVVIDGKDSSEVWDSFRVGRRARVFNVHGEYSETAPAIKASQDGYVRSARVTHTRGWRLQRGELTVRDALTGTGRHHVQWILHLHPEVALHRIAEHTIRFEHPGTGAHLTAHFDRLLSITTEDATYHPEFGRSVHTTRVVGHFTSVMPCELVCRFRAGRVPGTRSEEIW